MNRISYSDSAFVRLLYEFKYSYITLAQKSLKLLKECENEHKEGTRAWYHYKNTFDKWITCSNVVDTIIQCFTKNSSFTKWYNEMCINKKVEN